nr:NAD(P)-dependent alcohol dehydrogenase [uncultured Flavobacterium sp.]
MKSIVIHKAYGLENIAIRERPTPIINEDEVLVRVKAVSFNKLDMMIAAGALEKPLPHTLGSDAAGIVEQVGSRVTTLKIGDAVSTHYIQAWQSGALKNSDLKSRLGAELPGVFSEYIAIPEHYLVKIPVNLTLEEAASIPLAGVTAWEAVVNAGLLQKGQTVLLQGTGGVSLFALQFAKVIGARVIILSGSDEKLQRARALGADETINYIREADWAKKVLELTQGNGVDLALEMSWTDIDKTTQAMKLGGRIAVVGMLGGILAEVSVLGVMLKSLSIIGVQAGSKSSFLEMNKAIEANNIKPVIDKIFSVSELKQAVDYFGKGQHFGKIVLKF